MVVMNIQGSEAMSYQPSGRWETRGLEVLLMEEILHPLICVLSHYWQGFIDPKWCRSSPSTVPSLSWSKMIQNVFLDICTKTSPPFCKQNSLLTPDFIKWPCDHRGKHSQTWASIKLFLLNHKGSNTKLHPFVLDLYKNISTWHMTSKNSWLKTSTHCSKIQCQCPTKFWPNYNISPS